jgi:hypothetical protein
MDSHSKSTLKFAEKHDKGYKSAKSRALDMKKTSNRCPDCGAKMVNGKCLKC